MRRSVTPTDRVRERAFINSFCGAGADDGRREALPRWFGGARAIWLLAASLALGGAIAAGGQVPNLLSPQSAQPNLSQGPDGGSPTSATQPPPNSVQQAPAPLSDEGTQRNSRTQAGADQTETGRNQTGTQQQNQRSQRELDVPSKLTEFQRLIEETTGQQISAYGASLFRGVPSTFAPVENIPVTPDYVIGPGDQIRLQVYGQVDQQGLYLVDRNGEISIPQVGTIQVSGVRYSDLSEFLRSQLGRVYRNFNLNVTLGQLRSIQVFVVGQVRRPGSYTISSLSTLLNALFASGGPSAQGSLRDIQVKRGSETLVHFDLYDLLLRGDKSMDLRLLPGDVIFIPAVGPQVALLGSVNNAAIYELRGEMRVSQLLELSGGESNLAAEAQVRVERIFRHELRSIVQVNQAQMAQTLLQNGDIVNITAIVDRFKNAVTLRGNVVNPGRYMWHAGMRVTDLIPDKEMLITRDYWSKRSRLALPDPVEAAARPAGAEGSLQISASPGAGTGSTGSTTRGTTSASGGGSSVAAALSSGASLFTPRTDVLLSAPDIDWSYAVIERQNAGDLKTSLIPFNLGRAVLDRDAAQNPELLANDVVTIFSTADIRVPISQQTRFVRLEGEFAGAGVYSVKPGETLRQLVMRAGGFTQDAYLYASEFTRQSTLRVERQRLNDYADQLEAQVATVTAANSSRALNDRDAAAAESAASGARSSISRLRQLQPVGRIVLQLKPDSEGVSSLPELALEDGDRFIVPKIPANVYVEGQVYSANAFVFEPGLRTSKYLKLAGGPDREADRRRAFVLRADGSVLSRQYGNFEHALIYPGDTIVVPPMINKRAILRDLVDVSNIIGQFGFGVAAINVLK
jgi:polysaccharide export outer membrane protein